MDSCSSSLHSDKMLRGLIVPPGNWVQAVICSHLPAALEKKKPSWMGDDPRDVLVAMPAEGEVRQLVKIKDSSGRERCALPLAQIGESKQWICYAGSSARSKYNLRDLEIHDIDDMDAPPAKRRRGEHLAAFATDNPIWYDMLCAIAHYMAVKESRGSMDKAQEKMLACPFDWPSIPQRLIVRWTHEGSEEFAMKSVRGLLRVFSK